MKYMLLIHAGATDGADQCTFEDWVMYDRR